jgi:hypothetical protein
MEINQLAVLRWLHILAMVYWLGGEWGVFQTAYNVINPKLSLDERRRHMETAYRIDILARSGIILLLPLGLHMGHLWTVQPFGGKWLVLIWTLAIIWLALCWAAFFLRESDHGLRLTRLDEGVRFGLIPLLLFAAISSLMGYGPFNGDAGWRWYSAKILIYALLLILGLKLRFIMREWTILFRRLSVSPNRDVELQLGRSISVGRRIAYIYWVGIASVAFLGATKPF